MSKDSEFCMQGIRIPPVRIPDSTCKDFGYHISLDWIPDNITWSELMQSASTNQSKTPFTQKAYQSILRLTEGGDYGICISADPL